jgi:hypothetical protein
VGVFWKPLILLRWTVTMLIMTLLRHSFYQQIFLLLAISFAFQVMIVGSKPMLCRVDNNMLLFNEIMVSIYLYLLLCLTDFMRENDSTRDFIGFALLFLVVFTTLVNLIKFLIACDWCYLVRKFKKKCIKHKKHAMETKDTNSSLAKNEN